MSVLPVNSLDTPRFCGVPTFMRLPQATSLHGLDAAVIGLPSDSGAPFRTGARFGPNAVRAMSVMLRPINPYRGNINVFEKLACADVGDASVVPGYEVESLDRIEESVAALVTALLGALATSGEAQLAVAAAVVVTLLLNLKSRLHKWVDALSESEIAGVLRLLVISLVILPVLPDKGYGPYEALNPRTIWLFVVLISLLSFVGYLAIRILGPSKGYLATGLFGGMVSSTATTAALARLGRQDTKAVFPLAAGIALANAVMAVRMTVIVAAISPSLAIAAAWPLGCAALVALAFTLLLWRAKKSGAKGKAKGKAEEIRATETTPVLPGDVVKVDVNLPVTQ